MQRRQFTHLFNFFVGLILLAFFVSSCVVDKSARNSRRAGIKSNSIFYNNVHEAHAMVLLDNPLILSGNSSFSDDSSFAGFLSEQKITDNQFLIGSCTGNGAGVGDVTSCFNVLEKNLSAPITYKNKRWGYGPATSEWPQVQTFFHLNKFLTNYSASLRDIYSRAWSSSYQTSLPFTLYSSGGNWNKNQTLTTYSNDGIANNAFFSPAQFSISLGYAQNHPNVLMVQDPAVIYHETGHALVSIMMNMRNTSRLDRSELGYMLYDEGGAINEGIADFFSYYLNHRTHFAEWALGRFLSVSRPLSESDPIHMAGISKSDIERLSYPTYLIYDPNNPTQVIEEIHNAGMVASHFLVSLGEELQSSCLMTQTQSIQMTLQFMNETLSEMGDLTAQACDGCSEQVNLNSTSSLDWLKTANPINYHTFFQTFAKYMFLNYGTTGCFPKDNIEKLLDKYGLLLFKTYNEDGNNKTLGHSGTHTAVDQNNRLRSILISKDLIKFDPTANAAQAYVFDDQEEILSAIGALQAGGQIGQLSNQIPNDLGYNNSNSKISPGEVVGIALNLYNASNSPIAGVQVLANDWDHFSTDTTPRPCNNFGDNFPIESEGGSVSGDASCSYITRYNGAMKSAAYAIDQNSAIMPTCFIQKIGTAGSSQWVPQSELVSTLPDPSYCLSGSTNTSDCFLRAIKGADSANYSYIAPNSTWAKSLTNGDTAPTYSYSNIIFFEVNSRTPPGTTFNCRFRVRFSNCEDCYHDSSNANDNYLDYEFSGAKPFKILNLQFSVGD